MNGTDSTTTDATKAQERIAYLALAAHMLEHGLEAPHMVTLKPTERHMTLSLYAAGAEEWLESITVDGHGTEPDNSAAFLGGRTLRHVVDGRLPNLGIRVRLRWFERVTEQPLRVVGQ